MAKCVECGREYPEEVKAKGLDLCGNCWEKSIGQDMDMLAEVGLKRRRNTL